MTPVCSITIGTFNRCGLLDKSLQSIRRQTVPFPYEIVVADDGSTDATWQVCEVHGVVYRRIEREPTYRNPACARNLAVLAAQAPIILPQSDEVIHVTSNAIERLVALLQAHPNTVVLSTCYNYADGKRGRLYCGRKFHKPLLFLGALWRDDWLAVKGNDEEFTAINYEDKWFAQCLTRGLGRAFLYTPDVVVFHQDHPRPPKDLHDPMKTLYWRKWRAAMQGEHPWTARVSPWVTA